MEWKIKRLNSKGTQKKLTTNKANSHGSNDDDGHDGDADDDGASVRADFWSRSGRLDVFEVHVVVVGRVVGRHAQLHPLFRCWKL